MPSLSAARANGEHDIEVHAIRWWWGIHAQVEERGQFDSRRCDISASSAAAL